MSAWNQGKGQKLRGYDSVFGVLGPQLLCSLFATNSWILFILVWFGVTWALSAVSMSFVLPCPALSVGAAVVDVPRQIHPQKGSESKPSVAATDHHFLC